MNLDQVCPELFEAIKIQTKSMINLLISNNIAISSEMMLVALHINDLGMLNTISTYLNNDKKYRGKFFLRSKELEYILKTDKVELMESFKKFIHPEILCYTLNTAISNCTGELCLKKALQDKMIKNPDVIYLLLKTAMQKNGLDHLSTQILLEHCSPKIMHRAELDNNLDLLDIVLHKFIETLPIVNLRKTISSQIEKPSIKQHCLNILNKHYKKKHKNYRI